MTTLFEEARLTEEERLHLPDFEHDHNYTECDACEQYVADAATAKALWAVVEHVRRVVTEDYYMGPASTPSHYRRCRLCFRAGREGEDPLHAPSCLLAGDNP